MKCQKYTYFILKRNETFLGNILFLENVFMGKSWRFKIMIFSLLECPSMLMSREKIAPLSSLSSPLLLPFLYPRGQFMPRFPKKRSEERKKRYGRTRNFERAAVHSEWKSQDMYILFCFWHTLISEKTLRKKETFLYILLFHHHHLLLLFLPLSPPTP